MLYSQACRYLEELQFFTIKLGLEATGALLLHLGSPQNCYPAIHLAGTNGKGSAGAMLSSLLSTNGYKTGFYSSPHLGSIRERFQINGTLISQKEFADTAAIIINILQKRKITYFEFTTALAFLWFKNQQVDIAVIEAGLGGRLDATNVMFPLVSVITNIALDHQQYLGSTIEQITYEKAGIIKPHTPVVSGVEQQPAKNIIKKACAEKACPLYTLKDDFIIEQTSDTYRYLSTTTGYELDRLTIPLAGRHQKKNAALALAALEMVGQSGFTFTKQSLRKGLATVQWPGRMERLYTTANGQKYHYLLDGAHNEAGVACLLDTLKQDLAEKRIILLWGQMADKKTGVYFTELLQLAALIILTQAETERSASPRDMLESLPEPLPAKTICRDEVESALRSAEKHADTSSLICIAGSLYLVGKARELLTKRR
ncbi:MAG: bifunctional folylpolyglutamate synthase/ dihydrofolate synthase [Desulfobulbus propionicus]|nr:MAG: bifunctional folylpolyglutamate synthase/ dihydrofolate synthase [Desulfobulbus propionicus]